MRYLIFLMVLAGCKQHTPPCDPLFQKPVAYVDSVYRANGVSINYNKVHSIRKVTDSTMNNPFSALIYDGAFNRDLNIIYLNEYTHATYPEEYRNRFYCLVYAHELAHSQGMVEHSEDKSSIMYNNTSILDSLMIHCTVEELILKIYE